MLDQTDRQILELLSDNSRLKVKEIAEQVHLTAPAVSARLQKLEEKGIIRAYTIDIDRSQTGCAVHVVVTVTLNQPHHTAYQAYVHSFGYQVARHYRTAGAGCYMIELYFPNNEDLAVFLDGLEAFASYQVASVVNVVQIDKEKP
ncbi:Lrp/AsnC family transcriptional regulator [Streptococcus caprae]|uniref:Lrp/AsnC family transcriptional regulator n=1 Tax=Streptococcus caprae TaxID=1640501 RepID=A0ABV8CTX0_9STRE